MPDSNRDTVGLVVGTLAAFAIMLGGAISYWYLSHQLEYGANCLGRARREVVEVVGSERVDPTLVGKTIHLIGNLRVATGAEDREFGVRADDVVCLQRLVRFYQWVEEEIRKKPSEAPRYDYHRRWVSRPVDSGKFKTSDSLHRNTNKANLNVASSRIPAREVYLGGYRLDDSLKLALRDTTELEPDILPGGLAAGMLSIGNRYYLGANPQKPEIGDVRVDYFGVAPGRVSLVGVLGENGMVRGLQTVYPDCHDVYGPIWRQDHSAEEMLGGMELWHWFLLWAARAGLFLVYGLACLLLSKVWGWQGRGFGLAAALAVSVMMAAEFL